ncbi:hypothetical protein GUITHDRAFT_75084 [Guillardia theta CCMP2712]|uniref:alpha-1,2-Mannosidase n=2 Tax=Guillardia theta TaxID=55529 RepID=L1IYM0_GUITC|nr:hypothetical protein GUITHDRAFT_75084 [Guillardia theta CCMP2712]EKX40999.1 hypothetical protein GUITHDRAFT_75084 [Guillardia theta CCMP2712]|eukprot:XP_005827979.1 hypothetical protein GUITHDRAFT_75084 [Guillardia theta CCMP2712]
MAWRYGSKRTERLLLLLLLLLLSLTRCSPHLPDAPSLPPPLPPQRSLALPAPLTLTLASRRAQVREAIRHAWSGYMKYGRLGDDLKPVSRGVDNWMNARLTLFDSLDTLYLSGCQDLFHEAAQQVLAGGVPGDAIFPSKVFEYHIRIVGGLLSVHSLTGDARFLDLASRAADNVLEAMQNPSGLPYMHFRFVDRKRRPVTWLVSRTMDFIRASYDSAIWRNSLVGIGSMGPELRYLTRETGARRYEEAADRVLAEIHAAWKKLGGRNSSKPLPLWWDTPPRLSRSYRPLFNQLEGSEATLGSGGDSFFEYLLKEQLLQSSSRSQLVDMYEWLTSRLLDGHANQLIRRVHGVDFLVNRRCDYEHLTCFVPGMLALGASQLKGNRSSQLSLARRLMESCIYLYQASPTGLAPDTGSVCGDQFTANSPEYLLRPETVESLFILFRVTKDGRYREIAWEIFRSIEKYCKVESGGYSGLVNVNDVNGSKNDNMPSYFIAETLKYLYLIFDDAAVSLDDFVFTTEAHPLARYNRCDRQGVSRYHSECVSSSIDLFLLSPENLMLLLLLLTCLHRCRCVSLAWLKRALVQRIRSFLKRRRLGRHHMV